MGPEYEQSDCEQCYDGSGNDYVMLVTLFRSLDASVVGGFKGYRRCRQPHGLVAGNCCGLLAIVVAGWWLVVRRRLLVAGG